MRIWRKSAGGVRRVDVLLFERFSNHCLANAVEPLRAANDVLGRAAYAWAIMTPDDREVRSSSGLPVRPTASLASGERGDALLVMPSYGFRAHATPRCSAILRASGGRYGMLAGLDTGAWLLAEAGLLDGRRATIHHDEHDAFAERFPQVEAIRARTVIDGDRASAGGATAAFELVQELIARDHGAATTLEIAALFLAPGAAEGRAPRVTGDRVVDAAVAAMGAAVEAPPSLPALAAAAGCGPRELSRRFGRALGAPPGAVQRRIRLSAARRMLGGGMAVAEAAARTGYADASAFARAFRREFGISPRASR